MNIRIMSTPRLILYKRQCSLQCVDKKKHKGPNNRQKNTHVALKIEKNTSSYIDRKKTQGP